MQNFDLGVETQKRRCPLPTHQHRDHLRPACDVSPPQVPALLLIDLQLGFDEPNWGKRNNPELEIHAAALLGRWRELGWPVIHIQHSSTEPDSPLRPDHPGWAFKPETVPRPGETVFSKSVNSAFIGTPLADHLRQRGFEALVILGLTTDHCVSTSTRMAGNLGFHVDLVADATATFSRSDRDGREISAEDIHRIHLASLDREFCHVCTTAELLTRYPAPLKIRVR